MFELACRKCGYLFVTDKPEDSEGLCPVCTREEAERPAFDENDPEVRRRA